MQGKTKGFFEDIFVLVIIVAVGWGGYNFFFTEDTIVPVSETLHKQEGFYNKKEEVIVKVTSTPLEKNQTKLPEDSVEEKTEKLTDSDEKIQELKSENLTQNKKNIQNDQEFVTTAVDLQVLQNFLIQTKQKIKRSIILNNKNNEEKVDLSIRLTVLKNGNFEQLIYTGGNIDIFKNNYENIAQLFPLIIDEKIVAEFPRYLRYSFKFTKKEE